MNKPTADQKIYDTDYFLQRCGGFEFFQRYGHKVLKPSMQGAIIEAKLKPSDRILDIGFGRGELVAHLTDKGFDATGIDYAEAAVKCAQELYPQGKFHHLTSDQQFFEAESFDKIFVLGTIEHLDEPTIVKTLQEIKRLLRPGGLCIVTTCTNQLYYKVWTYKWRQQIASVLRKIGLNVRSPRPVKSEEDESMHVNEKSYFSLKRSMESINLSYVIKPRPNPQIIARELYGDILPEGFPLKAKSHLVQFFYRVFIFHFPLSLFLSRMNMIILKKPI